MILHFLRKNIYAHFFLNVSLLFFGSLGHLMHETISEMCIQEKGLKQVFIAIILGR